MKLFMILMLAANIAVAHYAISESEHYYDMQKALIGIAQNKMDYELRLHRSVTWRDMINRERFLMDLKVFAHQLTWQGNHKLHKPSDVEFI